MSILTENTDEIIALSVVIPTIVVMGYQASNGTRNNYANRTCLNDNWVLFWKESEHRVRGSAIGINRAFEDIPVTSLTTNNCQ